MPRQWPRKASVTSPGHLASPPSRPRFASHLDGLRDRARRGRLITGKRFSRSAPWTGKRAATGDWGFNCVGHPRNPGTRGDVCERWLSRSPIETPSNQPLGGVDRGQMGRPMRTTLGRWGRIPTGTPAAARHLKRRPPISFSTPSRGWGPVCPRPRKTGPVFPNREKRDGEQEARGRARRQAGRTRRRGARGARRRAPRSDQGRPEGKAAKAARDGQTGRPAKANRAGRSGQARGPRRWEGCAWGSPKHRPPCAPVPGKPDQEQRPKPCRRRGRLRRPPSGSLPLASPPGQRPWRCLSAPRGLAKRTWGGNNWGWTTPLNVLPNAQRTNY